jgi:hypothetical protein
MLRLLNNAEQYRCAVAGENELKDESSIPNYWSENQLID